MKRSLSDAERTLHVLDEVAAERTRQDNNWGVRKHLPIYWTSILGEEYGEVCRAINDIDLDNYREELVQCAAVSVAAIESLDAWRENIAKQDKNAPSK